MRSVVSGPLFINHNAQQASCVQRVESGRTRAAVKCSALHEGAACSNAGGWPAEGSLDRDKGRHARDDLVCHMAQHSAFIISDA